LLGAPALSERRTLLTGATGFIGSKLLAMLRERHHDAEVVTLASHPIPGCTTIVVDRDDRGVWDFGDVDLIGYGRFDVVFHLGAFTPKDHSQANDVALASSNIINTLALIDRLPPPKRFVFASTLDVYGMASQPLREDAPASPQSLYGASKLYCERMIQSWVTGHPYTKLTIARIGQIYGPGEAAYKKFIPETIRRLKNQLPPDVRSDGSERRSFLYVDDCCEALVALIDAGLDTEIVNVASAEPASIGDIAAMLSDIAREQGLAIPLWRPQGRVIVPDVIVDASLLNRIVDLPHTSLLTGLREEFLSVST
jgi:UDP-glucose 4-epimerase